tara:strand:+ start:1028 stop:1993 length:966 start_codon:yes stop_codon:yes gene_type:complete
MRKIVFLLACISFIACKKESEAISSSPTKVNLVQQLEQFPSISLFTKAVAACEDTLNASPNEITIYAPTNAVLNNFLQDAGAANFTELKAIIGTEFYRAWLGCHFFPSALRLEQMQTAYIPTLAFNPLGQQIHTYSQREKSILALNGQYVNLIDRDIAIPAGILHITNDKMQVPTISKLVSANGHSFSILKRALQLTDNSLASLLNREDQMYTLFAPNDAAFDQFFQEGGCSDLDDFIEKFGSQVLENLLSQHISQGSYDISSLNGHNIKSLYQNKNIYITLANGNLKVSNDAGFEAHIVQTDITAFNGRIQLIDQVLKLP